MRHHPDLSPLENPGQIRSYFRKEWPLVLSFSLTGTIFNLGQSIVLVMQGKLVDSVAKGSPLSAIIRDALSLMALVLFFQICRYVKRYDIRRFANRSTARMRLAVYQHLISKNLEELKQEKMGDLMTKAVGDVDITVEGIRKTTTEIFDTGVLMAGYVVALFVSSWKITLLCIWFTPLSMFLASRMKTIVTKTSRASREQQGIVAGMTYAMASKTVLLRTQSMEKPFLMRYREQLRILQKKATLSSLLEGSLGPIYQAIAGIGFLCVMYLGGKEVIQGSWTVGAFTSYILLLYAVTMKASKTSKLFNAWQKAEVSFERIKPFLCGRMQEDRSIHHPLEEPRDLRVSHLSFRYPDEEKYVLNDVCFTAQPGQIVGITGLVASGKSTLNIALEGLYPYEGSITLGGRELRDLTAFERGSFISWQGHQSELLCASIKENVALGEAGDIREVLKDVAFDQDMRHMSEGENTIVGSSGVRLSGGQGGRISLARALWRKTPLILLDDPFGSVDLATERDIIKALRSHYGNSIILLASHRLAMFPFTDQVGFIGIDGHLTMGTHKSQMETNPVYRNMYTLQETERNEE